MDKVQKKDCGMKYGSCGGGGVTQAAGTHVIGTRVSGGLLWKVKSSLCVYHEGMWGSGGTAPLILNHSTYR